MHIDTHIHSTYSDGTLTPEEIVKEAKEKKIDLIALTDHNTLNGDAEFAQYANKYNQNAIAGIEISTIYKKEEVHLLAYFPINSNFFYSQYDKLNELNNNYKYGKKGQLEEMIENIGKDYDVSVKEFYEFIKTIKSDENFNRVHIANYLMHKNITKSVQESFDIFLDEKSKYYVVKPQTKLLDAVKIVVESGGFPTIAHLEQYNLNDNEIKEMLTDVSKITNEFGVELFHYDHAKSDIQRFLTICKDIESKTNLKIIYTAGSDCHGKNKPNEIGKPYEKELDIEDEALYENVSNNFIKFLKEKEILKEPRNFTELEK